MSKSWQSRFAPKGTEIEQPEQGIEEWSEVNTQGQTGLVQNRGTPGIFEAIRGPMTGVPGKTGVGLPSNQGNYLKVHSFSREPG